MSNKTIDEIKKSSSYTIDPLNNLYICFCLTIVCFLGNFVMYSRIINLKNNGNKINNSNKKR